MATVIYTTASREEVRDFVRSLPGAITGSGHDHWGVGHGFRSRIAFTFFTLVAKNFDRLGKGLIGANNETWPRNSPKYLAYGKGPKSSRMGRGHMPMNFLGGPGSHGGQLGRPPLGTGQLTRSQLEKWWAIYLPERNYFLMSGYPFHQAQARAAAIAWEKVKRAGARTLLKTYGNRKDQVLVDRGLLRRSLQPGFLADGEGPDASYNVNQLHQIAEQEPGYIVCGTNHPHADKHHEGKGVPERRLWPRKMPGEWFGDMFDAVVMGLMRIRDLFEG